jgi:transposase
LPTSSTRRRGRDQCAPGQVYASGSDCEIEQLKADPHGRWRQAARAVMMLLSLHGLPPAQIAVLLDCHPATVRRWISRFNREGMAGLSDRPRSGRPRLGGRQLARRIAALLARPGTWTLPRIWRYLGRPQTSMRTLYRRVRLVAIWRRPKLTARGDPARDQVAADHVEVRQHNCRIRRAAGRDPSRNWCPGRSAA